MCSSARIGRPAATRPMSGRPSCTRSVSLRRMPREEPGTSSTQPLRASARRCSSAALGERKPSFSAISARVGGMPVSTSAWRMSCRTWDCRGVRSDMTVIIYSRRANTSERGPTCKVPKALKNLSQPADGPCCDSCNPRVDLVKLRLRSKHVAAQCGWRGAVGTYQTRISRGFTQMNKAIIVKLAAAAAVFALAGCTDLKPLQAEVDALKTQVGTLQSDLAAHKADRSAENAAGKASSDASPAASAAANAQSTANQALAAAQAAQSGVDATNEKIDRMFKKSVSK